ncbi:MAG: SDR family oxidoreductase [Oceanospirillaceae bacterium]|nr:SDR family oxidoreductase [Oceanospirillaceae bacterium]
MQDLQNKVVVVIGGTSGIGLAVVQAASEMGATVYAAGRSSENIEKAKLQCADQVNFRLADTHDDASLLALFAEAGEIDYLVSAATGAERTIAPFTEQTEEQFAAAFQKFWGYTKVVRNGESFVKATGSITLVTGTPARKYKPGMSSLSCTGGAVEAFIKALSVEIAPKRINGVSPGLINTAMWDVMGEEKQQKLADMTAHIPMARAGQAAEVAHGVIFAMTNTYTTGTIVDVEGGTLLT